MSPSSTNQFHVYLFGAFHIDVKAQSIRLPTRKTEFLLAYLILHPGAHSREKLAALFWGDSSNAAARGSLRKALTLLRKNINGKIIVSDRESIQLNPSSPVWVDVIEFQQQAKKFLVDPASHFNPNMWDLYQDDLLCNVYDDWVIPLREQYRLLYLDSKLRMVEILRAESEYKNAIRHAKEILSMDPANERAHQHLMFCHITLGNRNEALLQYEECQRALRDELAVEPTRETQALYRWIQQSGSEVPSLAARLTNLPIPISSFVGRGRELATVKQLLLKARLVTLTGAGGSGKTRLAIHAGTDHIDSFRDGVWWVELAQVTDPLLVPSTVAKSLGIDDHSDQPLMDTLKKFLRSKQILLVLDNCEHLIDASAKLAETLLSSCAELKILATSRETLDLFGEVVWQVPTLSLPEVQNITLMNLLMQYEGIRLFVERAAAINPNFTPNDAIAVAIAQVCRRLDGIPLAIELAAARIKTMSIKEISERLDDRFQLLTAGNRTSQTRHQTLRATIDWSYDLLTEDERQLFCRLSIFAGEWTLDAAEAVCSGEGIERGEISDLLARLVDKSLITANSEGQRYGMLETMRQYGRDKLGQTGTLDRIFQKYLDYYLKMAKTGDEKIRGHEQIKWHNWFRLEQDNLASAMERAVNSPPTLERGCELICAICWYWGIVGDFVVMKHWLEMALSRSSSFGDTPIKAKLLFNSGLFSVWGMIWLEPAKAQEAIEESMEIFQTLGADFTRERTVCLATLGYIRKSYFNDDRGYDYMNQAVSIFRETNNVWWQAWTLSFYGMINVWDNKDFEAIYQLLEEETVLWNQTGDKFSLVFPLADLGALCLRYGKLLEAKNRFERSLEIAREFRAKPPVLELLQYLGKTALGLKEYKKAKVYYEESLLLSQAIRWDNWLFSIHHGLGYVSLHLGENQDAEEHFYRALKLAMDSDSKRGCLLGIAGFASLAVTRREPATATRLFGAFFAQIEALQKVSKSNNNLINPVNQVEIDEYLTLCRSQIEENAFEIAWNSGRAMTLNEALNEISKMFAQTYTD